MINNTPPRAPQTAQEMQDLLFKHSGLPDGFTATPIPEDELAQISMVKMGWDVTPGGGSIMIMENGDVYAGDGQDTGTYTNLGEAIKAFQWSEK